jgi:hypothetical protein
MNLEILLRLGILVPFIYAGLYTLTDPSSSIRVANKFMADAHQIEAGTILGEIFGEPTPIVNSPRNCLYWRIAGVAMMAAGLLRLYAL